MAVSKSTGNAVPDTTQPIRAKPTRDRWPQTQVRQEASPSPRIDDDEEQRQARGNRPPRLGVNFTEAVGKVIAFVNVINDPPNWQALEVRFTDGTLLHFELEAAATRIKPTYMEMRHGNLELIRSYGTLLTDDERTARERATGGDDDGPYGV